MKPIIILSMTFALAAVGSTQLLAQTGKGKKIQEEKIIVEGKDGRGDMTIEIKDGEVFIDGKKVEGNPDGENEKGNTIIRKKIIVNGKDVSDDPAYRDFGLPFQGMDMQSPNRPLLGVNTKPTEQNDGAEIENVVPGSPADKFGLKAGDVITRVDGRNIYSPKDLVDAVAEHKPGDKVDITFERGAEFLTKNVQLSERKDAMNFQGTMPLDQEEFFRGFGRLFEPGQGLEWNADLPRPSASSAPKIGVSVEDRADGEGVLVNEVSEASAAQKAGVQRGDVITRFGSSEIGNVDDLMNAIRSNQQKSAVDLEVKRNGQARKLSLSVPKNLKKRDL